MKYFFDTEFVETVGHIELISIGIMAEDGRTYYAVNRHADLSQADPWVIANVLDKMPEYDDFSNTLCHETDASKSMNEIWNDLLNFTGQFNDAGPEQCTFYAYYCSYDWVVFCWIFGRMIDLPKGYPMYCRDLKHMLDALVDVDSLGSMLTMDGEPVTFEMVLKKIKERTDFPKQKNEHDALDDAKWNFELYKFIKNIAQAENNIIEGYSKGAAIPLPVAVNTLSSALKADEEYRYGWQSNIAVAFQDAYKQYFDPLTEDSGEVHEDSQIHAISNNAADQFLNTLINSTSL